MDSSEKAEAIFKRTYGKQRNFMTPNLIRYGMLAPYVAYELSWGTGIVNETIYGVTVLRSRYGKPTEKLRDVSKCFETRAEAENHINELKEVFLNEKA